MIHQLKVMLVETGESMATVNDGEQPQIPPSAEGVPSGCSVRRSPFAVFFVGQVCLDLT